MNYYDEIKNKIIDNEIYAKVKDYSKERYKLKTYIEIGELLYNANSQYGDKIIKEYSQRLSNDLNKNYSVRYLFDIRKLYLFIKVHPLGAQLTMSHCRILFRLNNSDEIEYYINQVIDKNLSKRELEILIKNKEYDRLPIETRNKILNKEQLEVRDLVPNPILIKNKNNIEIINEKAFHQLILEDIESFMHELGNSFCFIGSEYKIKIGDSYHKIDLLFFNIKYNAYVVVELKITEFKVEYISQVQKYMNYIDKNIKEITNNNTIGILICKKENKFVIEYCSDERIAVREYELV
ncbi:MAG TPA: DUF1016 domain-containing protein [Tenericutes bacterium]|nr:DUF1016 domain-containing protein [Mycoplasmatota bacterium]